jgi:nitrogen fixation NifU-like protein
MAYSDKVLDHYENPRNVGAFDTGDDAVGTGLAGAPAWGDVMKLQIKVHDQGLIEDAIKAAVADYKAKHEKAAA